MPTLLLRLSGPLQSWGAASRFDLRSSEQTPSKSAVIGMIAAAMGRGRAQDVSDLAALRMGVRVDRPGSLLIDYHTVGAGYVDTRGRPSGVPSANGVSRRAVVTRRAYLQDAAFLVGLDGDRSVLVDVNEALRAPRWPLGLGRRSCPPVPPVHAADGLVDRPLVEALRSAPWPWAEPPASATELELVIEDPTGAERAFDQPVDGFASRRYAPRRLSRLSTPVPEAV